MNRILHARMLVATSALLSLASCDALFGGLAKGNPESCVATPSICNADTEICNAETRECEPALRIDSLSPSAAPYDTAVSVTLTGKNFVSDMQFLIDGKPATSVVLQSDTSLTATVPASSGNKALLPGELVTSTMQRLRKEGLFHYFPWPQFSIPSNQPLSGFIKNIRSGDLNGDGRPDIAIAADNSAGVAIFMGQPDGTLAASAPAVFSSRPFFVAIGDLNGDGKVDLVSANGSTNNVSLALSSGVGVFAVPTNVAVGTTPSGVFVTDLDGDKFADIVVSNNASSAVSILIGTGNGGAAAAVNTTLGTNRPDSVWVSDLDGDGQPDIVTSNGANNNLSFLRRASAIQYTVSAYTTGTTPSGITVADFNKDGFPDIAVAASGSNQAQVYLSTCK